MAPALWLLLTIGASSVVADETLNSIPVVQQFELAKSIYEKQKDCDEIVGEAVVKALDKGDSYEFPVPDRRYFQCKEILDVKKREYITAYLGGIRFHPKSFQIMLSNKNTVTLASPSDETLSSESDRNNFDIPTLLCVTNNLCLTLSNIKVSNNNEEDVNEKKKSVSRCLNFLDDLKLKYMKELKISERVLDKKLGGLPGICTYGELLFTFPKKRNTEENFSFWRPDGSKNGIRPEGNNKGSKQTVSVTAEYLPKNDDKNQFDKEVSDSKSRDSVPAQGEVGSLEENTDVKINDATDKVESGNVKSSENEVLFSVKSSEKDSSRAAKTKDADAYQEEEVKNETIKSEKIMEENKVDTFTPVSKLEEKELSRTNNEKRSMKKKHNKRKSRKHKNDGNAELVVKVVSKNGDGRVIKIRASGRIKKTETASSTANPEGKTSSSQQVSSGLVSDGQSENEYEAAPEQLLLVFSTTLVSSEDPAGSMASVPYTLPEHSPFKFADVIYEKQRECDAIVGEAVIKALDKGEYYELPVPDERYLQCKEFLDNRKREYIKSYLEGLGYYLMSFPLVLSSGARVKLTAPPDDTLPTDRNKFDIQQELCVTNQVCLALVRLKFSNYNLEDSNEQEKSVTLCLAFLNDLKYRYIQVMRLDESELRRGGRGLPLVCTDRQLTLALPKEKNDVDSQNTFEAPEKKQSRESKEQTQKNRKESDKKPSADNVETKTEPSSIKGGESESFDNVVNEVKSLFARKSHDQGTADQQHYDKDLTGVPLENVSPAHIKDVENLITKMEEDCEELIEWEVQPTLLRSVLKFKQLYDECVESLNEMKRAYQQQLKGPSK